MKFYVARLSGARYLMLGANLNKLVLNVNREARFIIQTGLDGYL